MSDRIGHRHHGEAEGERDAEETDPQLRKGGGNDRASAAAKCQPKSTEKFRDRTLAKMSGQNLAYNTEGDLASAAGMAFTTRVGTFLSAALTSGSSSDKIVN